MLKNNILKKLKLNAIFTPVAIVTLSCSLLIFTNYFTIKILSASRAYVNGESHYSKAQKDGARHLITYLFTKDSTSWIAFNNELSVSKGDGAARIGLINNSDIEVIKDGLRAGRNDEKDLDAMIWLFNNFKTVSFFKKAIDEWEKADYSIEQLHALGNEINRKISANKLTQNEKKDILQRVNILSVTLSKNQNDFSNALGEGTRSIKNYLLLINIFLTLIIIGSVSTYYALMINKLKSAKIESDEKNKNLMIANKELDKFVYSASHDLRAPISSLKGLIEVMKLEDDIHQVKDYLNLMDESLNKQDQFIKDIIDYSRNKKQKTTITLVSLSKIIEEAISQNQYAKQSNQITITRELAINELYSNELKLKIIINNLLSNAFKYADQKKENQFISIKAFSEGDYYKIEIEDNGLGINEKYHDKIFEMFFVTTNDNNGSGLGLYIVKEAIENLNGLITVDSKINTGSKFTITLPKQYESQL